MFHEPLGGERKPRGVILLATLVCFLILINAFIICFYQDNETKVMTQLEERRSIAEVSRAADMTSNEEENEVIVTTNKKSEDTTSEDTSQIAQQTSQTSTQNADLQITAENKIQNKALFSKPSVITNKPSAGSVNVTVVGRELFVNGNKFVIKGVGYQPTPIGYGSGTETVWTNNAAILDRDFKLLKKMGVNTIKLWARVTPTLLDKAYEYNLSVIAGYWIDQSTNFADNTTRTNILNNFKSYVTTYKDYPALLMWNLGNEQNRGSGDNINWYSLANEMAAAAKQIEGVNYHPSAIVNLEILNINDASKGTTDAQLPSVDIWGVNTYRGISFTNLFTSYAGKSSKPLWISEYGVDSWNHNAGTEYQDSQAAWEVAQYNEIKNNAAVCIGGTIMEYSDEYWKWWNGASWAVQEPGGYSALNNHPDNYADEEYWGIVSVAKNGTSLDIITPKKTYYSLRDAFRGYNNAPAINLTDMTATAGSLVTLALPLTDADGDDIVYTISTPLTNGRWQTNTSDVGDYTITVSANDGSSTTTKSFALSITNAPSCIEDWQVYYGSCSINDTKLKYYLDNNSCGTSNSLPADNGTSVSCDYCTPNWIAHNTSCNGTAIVQYYTDINGCYETTGLDSDLEGMPTNSSFVCSLSSVEAFDFYDPLENLSTIAQNHGAVFGNVTFVPGVKGNAVQFDDKTYINYTNPMFKSENGSVSMWIKKNTNDTSGGIWQIGTLGVGRYIGLFYNFGTAAIAEIWGAGNYQAWGYYYLSQERFTHVVVTWETYRPANKTYIATYSNGEVDYSWVAYPYPFEHNYTSLEVGRTGWYGFGNVTVDELRFFNKTLNSSDVNALLYSEANSTAPVLNDLKNITVTEGDIAFVNASATDADGDSLTYIYGYPFNSSGMWQPKIGEAGRNYHFSVTVYDGTLKSETKYAYVNVTRKRFGNCSMSFYDSLENNSTFSDYCATAYGNLTFSPAVSGNGANLSGENAYITYDNSDIASQNGTVSFWFKKTTNQTQGGLFEIGKYGDHINGNLAVVYWSNNLHLASDTKGGSWEYTNILGSLTDKFMQVAISWSNFGLNNSIIKVYLNGSLVLTKNYPASFNQVNQFLDIGTAHLGFGSTPGIYDELRFVNRTLSDNEIRNLYNTHIVPIVYGDLSGDGNFTMADLNYLVDILLLRISAPAQGTTAFIAGDVNGDGSLSLVDLNWYVDKLLMRITKFPVEN